MVIEQASEIRLSSISIAGPQAQQLATHAAAIEFVQDAFAHLKVIGHTAAAMPLLQKANIMPDGGVIAMQAGSSSSRFRNQAAKGRT